MKTLLAIIGGLAVIGISVLYGIGWMAEHSDTAPARPGGTTSTPGTENPPGIPLGQGKDPLGEGFNGCRHSTERISRMFQKDDQGNKTYTGHLSIWLRTDCSTAFDLPTASGIGVDPVTGREARLWVDCNRELFWLEYVRYTNNGQTVRENTTAKQREELEANRDGEIMTPNSLMDQATRQACKAVSTEGTVK